MSSHNLPSVDVGWEIVTAGGATEAIFFASFIP